MKNSLYVGCRFGNNKKVTKPFMDLLNKYKDCISEVYLECWDDDCEEITISLKEGYYFKSVDPYDKVTLVHEIDLNLLKWYLTKDVEKVVY